MITPHFSLAETFHTDQTAFVQQNEQEALKHMSSLTELCKLMEQVRSLLGDHPINVHSMFRSVELNAHINGSATSQHCKGEACDFDVSGLTLQEAFDKLRHSNLKWGQLLLEGHSTAGYGWLHISLGAPHRDIAKCQQVATVQGKVFTWL